MSKISWVTILQVWMQLMMISLTCQHLVMLLLLSVICFRTSLSWSCQRGKKSASQNTSRSWSSLHVWHCFSFYIRYGLAMNKNKKRRSTEVPISYTQTTCYWASLLQGTEGRKEVTYIIYNKSSWLVTQSEVQTNRHEREKCHRSQHIIMTGQYKSLILRGASGNKDVEPTQSNDKVCIIRGTWNSSCKFLIIIEDKLLN